MSAAVASDLDLAWYAPPPNLAIIRPELKWFDVLLSGPPNKVEGRAAAGGLFTRSDKRAALWLEK